MLWTINHTFRVYLNFFFVKKKSSCWTFSFPVSLSHLGYNYYRWFSARGVCQLIWFPAFIYPFSSVQNSWRCFWFLSYRYLIFNSILICNYSKLNLRAQCPNIVNIDEPFAYYLWTQRACSCFVLYCLDFWKHGS